MTNWLDDHQQKVWRQFLRARWELDAALARQLQTESALSMPDFEVLVLLTDVPDGALRISELARSLHWERSRLSHHLKRMSARGLIERQHCGSDGRGAFAVVTDEGRRAIQDAAPGHVAAVRRLLIDVLTPAELDQLGRISGKVLAAVEDFEGGQGV